MFSLDGSCSDKRVIVTLSGVNYLTRKVQVLMKDGPWGIVNGNKIKSAPEQGADKFITTDCSFS